MVARAVTAPLVIALDVGGTKILSGLVDRDGNVLAEHRVATPDRSQEEALAAMDSAVVCQVRAPFRQPPGVSVLRDVVGMRQVVHTRQHGAKHLAIR